MPCFGVSHFTFISLFSIKKNNLSKNFYFFLCKQKTKKNKQMSTKNFVLVTKQHFNLDRLLHYSTIVWFLQKFTFLLWKWESVHWQILFLYKSLYTNEQSQHYFTQSIYTENIHLNYSERKTAGFNTIICRIRI